MSLTSEQRSAIANQLSVSLNTVTDERLIELCLLHDSAPDVRPEFAQVLNIDISRRFDAIKIASDPTVFSVAQSFADKFKLPKNLNESQKAAITAQLSTDLSTVDDGKLIELCVLYRSNLTLYPEFYDALKAEITRRFTSSAINTNSTTFAAVQILANNFGGEVPEFARKMSEMLVSADRDAWFQTNSEYMTTAAESKELMAWLISQSDILTAILENEYGAPFIVKSKVALTAILSDTAGFDTFKIIPSVWGALAGDIIGINTVLGIPTVKSYIFNNSVAMDGLISTTLGINAMLATPEKIDEIADSTVALKSFVLSDTARLALVNKNTELQRVKDKIYTTLQAFWVKSDTVSELIAPTSTGSTARKLVMPIASKPRGIVLASIPRSNGQVQHFNAHDAFSTYAFAGSQRAGNPANLSVLNGVTFNNCFLVYSTDSQAAGYFELWTPPA